MSQHANMLRRECERSLVDALPQGLKDAIDAALAKGATLADILDRVSVHAARGRSLTRLAVEAYLASKEKSGG